MLRIAIAEDEPAVAEQLQGYVVRCCEENQQQADVTIFPDGMALVENYHAIWDIILLDIKMPNLDGMHSAQRIRQLDPAVILIFVTSLARFAIKGYEVDALDFILKPVKYPAFSLK